MAKQMLTRLRFSGDVIERVTHLIRHHMFASDDTLTDAAIRRFINRVGAANVDGLFALRRADITASGLPERNPVELDRFVARVHHELQGPSAFGVNDLAIDGSEVITIMQQLKLVPGDFRGDGRVGAALRHALECVLEDPTKNTPQSLRAIVRDYLKRGNRQA
jgi:NAD-dependent DNA ligase